MTSPAENHWRLAYKHRAGAYKARARAAKEAGSVRIWKPLFPQRLVDALKGILSNLDDPAVIEKLGEFRHILLEEHMRDRREATFEAEANPSEDSAKELEERLQKWFDLLDATDRLGSHLKHANLHDIAAAAHTQVGDGLAATGQ